MQRLPLTDLPRVLIEAGYESPTYRRLYELALSARFPAKRNVAGRWTFAVDDLPQIADALGLSDIAA
jgi:hypothetical protein